MGGRVGIALEATDISRACSIMGSAGSDVLPKRYYIVIAGEAAEETIRAIESLAAATHRKVEHTRAA